MFGVKTGDTCDNNTTASSPKGCIELCLVYLARNDSRSSIWYPTRNGAHKMSGRAGRPVICERPSLKLTGNLTPLTQSELLDLLRCHQSIGYINQLFILPERAQASHWLKYVTRYIPVHSGAPDWSAPSPQPFSVLLCRTTPQFAPQSALAGLPADSGASHSPSHEKVKKDRFPEPSPGKKKQNLGKI